MTEPSLLGLSSRRNRLQCHRLAAAVCSGRHTHKRVDQVGAVLHEPGLAKQRHSRLPANPTQLSWRPRGPLRSAAHVELSPGNPAPEPSDSVHDLWRPLAELTARFPCQRPQGFHVLAPRRTPAFAAVRAEPTFATPAASTFLRAA
jgi:hypothetical protein